MLPNCIVDYEHLYEPLEFFSVFVSKVLSMYNEKTREKKPLIQNSFSEKSSIQTKIIFKMIAIHCHILSLFRDVFSDMEV